MLARPGVFGQPVAVHLTDLIAPRSCAFCGTPARRNETNPCAGCSSDLPWREPAVSPPGGLFERQVAMLDYAFPVDVAIKAFKFDRRLFYAPAFAAILLQGLPLLPRDIDGVLAVPLHWRRKTRRGFNQASEIARPVAKTLGVPVLRSVRRRKATPFQSGLKAADRARNLKRAFVASCGIPEQHVLIVDDVVTTGATMTAVAEVLLGAGAGKVSALAIARAGVTARPR